MFSRHPRLRCATAAAMTCVLCLSAVIPQKAFSATQDVRTILAFYIATVPGTCEAVGIAGGSNELRELAAAGAEVRIPCEVVSADRPNEAVHDAPDEVVRNNGPEMLCTPGGAGGWSCKSFESVMQADFAAMGKNGDRIARARARVMEILAEPNSCSGWFRQKDPSVLRTFRTLNFHIDPKGANLVRAVRGVWPEVILNYPYVARAIQEGGAYQTVTLNLNGAFFQGTAGVMETSKEGGAPRFLTPLELGVGHYHGGTLAAQVATFLHELGHLEGLLAADEGDIEGKSKHNTEEVLQYCKAEVESSGKRSTLTALR